MLRLPLQDAGIARYCFCLTSCPDCRSLITDFATLHSAAARAAMLRHAQAFDTMLRRHADLLSHAIMPPDAAGFDADYFSAPRAALSL